LTFNIVLNKVAFVNATICPSKYAYTVFLAICVLAFKLCSIWPSFDSFAMLLVFLPLTYILSAI
jgi:hypothetical protein